MGKNTQGANNTNSKRGQSMGVNKKGQENAIQSGEQKEGSPVDDYSEQRRNTQLLNIDGSDQNDDNNIRSTEPNFASPQK